MPKVDSLYKVKWWLRSMHISTIWASQFRKKPKLVLVRKRVELDDGDFIDIDESRHGNKRAVLLLHGLEGSSKSRYMQNMASTFINDKWDAILMNHRSCSGEDNRLYSCYHSGKSDDLNRILNHINNAYNYESIVTIGFSLGGNVSLKYLGESWLKPDNLKACISISPPIDLEACGVALNSRKNWVYARTFLSTMRKKLEAKLTKFPDKDSGQLERVKTLYDFDNEYTGPAHNFGDAQGYYDNCSSKPFIKNITLPTLILLAKNDSFMQSSCYPYDIVATLKNVYLETPEYGGHVGFVQKGTYYQEERALSFVHSILNGLDFK